MILGFSTATFVGAEMVKSSWSMVHITQLIALLGIINFIIFNITIAIIRFFAGLTQEVQLEKTFSAIVIFFAVMSYEPVVKGVDSLVDLIENSIRNPKATFTQVAINAVQMGSSNPAGVIKANPTTNTANGTTPPNGQQAAQQTQVVAQQNLNTPDNGDTKEDGFLSSISKGMSVLTHPTEFIASMVSKGTTWVIRMIMSFLSSFLMLILIVVGPLAAMFQCAPWIGNGMLKHWFTALLSIKFWGVTMAIIDSLQSIYIDNYFTFFGGSQKNPMSMIGTTLMEGPMGMTLPDPLHTIISFVFIILYIMTPKITTYYIHGAGGSMMSAAVAGGTTIITSMSSGAQIAAAGMTGGATALGSAGAAALGGSMGNNAIAVSLNQLNQTLQQTAKAQNQGSNSH